MQKVVDRGACGEELWVREDLEVDSGAVDRELEEKSAVFRGNMLCRGVVRGLLSPGRGPPSGKER